jgi:hypothetical protein
MGRACSMHEDAECICDFGGIIRRKESDLDIERRIILQEVLGEPTAYFSACLSVW